MCNSLLVSFATGKYIYWETWRVSKIKKIFPTLLHTDVLPLFTNTSNGRANYNKFVFYSVNLWIVVFSLHKFLWKPSFRFIPHVLYEYFSLKNLGTLEKM